METEPELLPASAGRKPRRQTSPAFVVLFSAVALVSCVGVSPAERAERREQRELARLVAPKLRPALVSKQQESDFFAVLRLYAEKPAGDEVITEFKFTSANTAEIQFSWSFGFHGGVARYERKDGRWIQTEKVWLM